MIAILLSIFTPVMLSVSILNTDQKDIENPGISEYAIVATMLILCGIGTYHILKVLGV